ncbi:4-hydroxy-tetrahydrodipicolinate synthase [Sediminibacterium sp. TEGAF015]|uniref:4-hydroxy-tetrahydrodipicolinate synthase n=1 Tax=Sediminibacterium sp. TEGAF015 TaxID=575378 RepID=UPI002203B86B|nr:4-hydroxy-tetrahydrodipicolinate synthase [Sediminibacterium sp. TEGAF015]BDQ11818.1 4-hydroxy-tetrahydrodipicolinate synthase [Sediminibacterium sp. TEGAF015]
MQVQDQLRGTGVAVITPFTKESKIDFSALGNVIDFLICNKVEYLVLLGTTGETPVLSSSEKIEILEYAYEKIAGSVPVVVGIGGNDTAHLLEDFKQLPLEKATAVLSAAPYYNKPSQEGIFQHYKLVAEASPQPVILYNVPGRTGRNMTAGTTLRLANEVPNIIGIKEASGDMAQCMQILKDRPDGFLVLSGDDALALPQIACGMEGVISVAANAFPLEFSNMVRSCLSNEYAAARVINDKLIPTYDLMFAENNPAGVKAFMYKMGLIDNQLRLPNVPLSQPVYSAIEAWMANNR